MAKRLEYKIIEAILFIQSGTYPNAVQLAEKLGCSKRTAERYIERIRDFVADELVYDRERGGYCFKSGGLKLPAIRLTEGEAVALFLGGKLLDQCRGTPYREHVANALEKMATYLSREVSFAEVAQPAGWVSFDVGPLRGEEHAILHSFVKVQQAIQHRETLRIVYFTAYRGEVNEREIDPYHLHLHSGVWYVFAYCHLRGEVKIFALDRMQSVEGTGKTFERPADFSAEEFMAASFGIERGEPADVAIRFKPEQARYVRERHWHSSQVIEELPDGGLILRLHVGGLGEVRRWVLSYGAGAEVLEPPELREAVRREVEGMVGVYEVARTIELEG